MVLIKQLVLISIFLLILLLSETHTRKRIPLSHTLPSYFPTCYRNDPQLNKCLLEATNQVRPFLAKGVPELRLPPFEPFTIPEIQLEQGTNALNFKAVLKNVTVHGLTKYDFSSRFDFDIPTLQFFCEAKIPGLRLEGDHTVTGSVLGAPIEGKGKFTAQIDSCDVYIYQKYKETLKDGKIHLLPTMTNSSIEVSGPKVDIKGLFNGNEQLGATTNKAINDNVNELFAELKPVVEQTLTKILEDVLLGSFTENIPWDDLYPVKKIN